MKKVLLFLGMAVFGVAAQAQDFKPVAGDVTTEFGLSGGISKTDFNLNEGGAALLRFRYFQTESIAFRAGFNLSSLNDKSNFYGAAGSADADKKGTLTKSGTEFLFNLGVEKHFAGTDRLSPYVGADILFGTGSQKVKHENVNNGANAFQNDFNKEDKGPGYVSVGLRAVVGADYYIAKRLYLGVEAGFGFVYAKEGKEKITTTTGGTTTVVENKSSGSTFNIKPSVITGVRVGFAF